jgi:Neuraminidase (sialidase)
MTNLVRSFQRYVQALFGGVVSLGLPLAVADQALAQVYGPRQFLPAPSGTNAVVFQIKNFDTNTAVDTSIVYPNLDIDTDAFVFSYTRNFSIGGTSGQVVVTQPVAIVDAQGSLGDFTIGRSNTGLADTQVEFRAGILGITWGESRGICAIFGSGKPRCGDERSAQRHLPNRGLQH